MNEPNNKETRTTQPSEEVGCSELLAEDSAPVDNGIEFLDSICAKFNSGEINVCSLVCDIWNYQEHKIQTLKNKVEEAVKNFDDIGWGYDGDCGSQRIIDDLDEFISS